MGLWKKGFERNNNGSVRLEDDRANLIDEFFASQGQVVSYEIVDKTNWVVNVDGSIHLYDDDLDDGVLFFKIGKLTGTLYCHCRHVSPSVIPADMDGEIVFVPDEKERSSEHVNDSEPDILSMGYNVKKDPTAESLEKDLIRVLRDSLSFGIPLDVEKIKANVENQIIEETKKEYGLRLVPKHDPVERGRKDSISEYHIYLTNEDKPLNLEASQKAFYLTYLLFEDGLKLVEVEMSDEFKSIMQKIYRQLPHKSYNKHNLLDKSGYDMWSTSRINPMRTHIMKAVRRIIMNTRIAKEFCIEMSDDVQDNGKRANEIYLIARSTPEIRAQIRIDFGL